MRMEDIDEPRCRDEHAADILRTLGALGFAWDGEVLVQSQRKEVYAAAAEQLRQAGWLYPCGCSRQEVGAGPYPGTCRAGLQGKVARAWRVKVGEEEIRFVDSILGEQRFSLSKDAGDFVVKRADGYWAYQLAVVVDDEEQGVTEVVRGADLVDSTPRQIHLQRLLEYRCLRYAHIPAALDQGGQKLSKQTGAPPIDVGRKEQWFWGALDYLGQQPPADLKRATINEQWQWAQENWTLAKIPQVASRPACDGLR
ncbi:MAG: tRNA glutamyl-Q(34) synthetase GluQRS [Bryobacter sp.]